MFYLAPLALIALVGLAADGVVPRRRRPLAAAAVVAGVLPFFIPFDRFITTSAVSDTFALLPWWWVQDHRIHLDQVRWAALGVSLAARRSSFCCRAATRSSCRRSSARTSSLTAFVVENGRHGIHQATVGTLWAGIHNRAPRLDRPRRRPRRVGRVLWTGGAPDEPVWENEFFNRSLGTVYDADTPRTPTRCPRPP